MTGFDITKVQTLGFRPDGRGQRRSCQQRRYWADALLAEVFAYGGLPLRRDRRAATSAYVQDRRTPSNRFADVRFARRYADFHDRPAENRRVAAETYRDGIKVDVSKYPGVHLESSRRAWVSTGNRSEDGSLQLRGGTGLFTGTPPYVWISNQAGKQRRAFRVDRHGRRGAENLGFLGSIDQNANMYKPRRGGLSHAEIAVTDPRFQVSEPVEEQSCARLKWRGWVLTLEALQRRDVNAILP